MRRGLTIIELVFSMVIIAIVFTVVPRIIYAANKSMELSIKEDALFNAMSMMGRIMYLPWDEKNTRINDILKTDSGKFPCLSDGYRVGGFKGSRNCIDTSGEDLSASAIGQDSGSDDFNDIDDYDGYGISTKNNGKSMYDLNVSVANVDDDYENTAQNDSVSITYKDTSASTGTTTNIKEVNVTVTLSSGSNRHIKPFSSTFTYRSINLGQIYINRVSWK